mgnify:CR=1 FL=1
MSKSILILERENKPNQFQMSIANKIFNKSNYRNTQLNSDQTAYLLTMAYRLPHTESREKVESTATMPAFNDLVRNSDDLRNLRRTSFSRPTDSIDRLRTDSP